MIWSIIHPHVISNLYEFVSSVKHVGNQFLFPYNETETVWLTASFKIYILMLKQNWRNYQFWMDFLFKSVYMTNNSQETHILEKMYSTVSRFG